MVVAQQWWLAKPLTYLATGHPKVSVSMSLDLDDKSVQDAVHNSRLFFVEFVGTPELAKSIDWIRARGLRASQTTVPDAGGRDLVAIVQVSGSSP
jgi:hypothetical protein